MSILQILNESLESDAPVYLEFLHRYDPKKKQVFAFYEGDEDSSFYSHFLNDYIDTDCELEEIVAGCKNNVLKLHREFDWERFDERQIVFFVDRDLSFWLNENSNYGKNVFVTDGYSVENYVANEQTFRHWLLKFEGFARASKAEIDSMVLVYKNLNAEFNMAMMSIMAKAVIAKKHDKSVVLDKYKLSRYLSFNIENDCVIYQIGEVNDIYEKWQLTAEDEKDILDQIQKFMRYNEHYSVRGKWAVYFMAQLGEYMRMNADFFAPSLGGQKKISPTCAVTPQQCFTVLAPYCCNIIPERLKETLEQTYCLYCLKQMALI